MGVALDLKPSYHLKGTTKQRKSRACAAGDEGSESRQRADRGPGLFECLVGRKDHRISDPAVRGIMGLAESLRLVRMLSADAYTPA